MRALALQGVRRWARNHMTERATIRRRVHSAGGDPRLSEAATIVATDVPFHLTRSLLQPVEPIQDIQEMRVGQYIGHAPLGTDIRRHDEITVNGQVYRVLGFVDSTTWQTELRVTLEAIFYDQAEMP